MNEVLNCNGFLFTRFSTAEAQTFADSVVYMFCNRYTNGAINILYVGEAENAYTRIGPSHEHWKEALALGMNEIHLHFLARTKEDRLKVETVIRNIVRPPLNRQETSLDTLAKALREYSPMRGGILGSRQSAESILFGLSGLLDKKK